MEQLNNERDALTFLSLNELTEYISALQEKQRDLTAEYQKAIELRKEMWLQGEQL
jgi:uncharacterized small protein (DUF1192 family)